MEFYCRETHGALDQSTEYLISDNKIYTIVSQKRSRKVTDNLRIAIWILLLLSLFFAITAFVLIVTSYQLPLRTQDDGEIASQENVNNIGLLASRKTARVVLNRLPLPAMELEFAFQIKNGSTKTPESCQTEVRGAFQCVSWPGPQGIRLTLSELDVEGAECYNLKLEATRDPEALLSVCLYLHEKQLYGGPTLTEQRWPAQVSPSLERATYMSGHGQITGVAERFWITSDGVALFVPPDVPLFVSHNVSQLCLESSLRPPYHRKGASKVSLNVMMCGAPDARQVFLAASRAFLGTPNELPDERMLQFPIWSTWAKFKTAIDSDSILQFAQNITKFGFPNSQLEIDDKWETCYGDQEFNNVTFPNATKLVEQLHELGFRVTLWIHPFQNTECKSYQHARDLDLLVHNNKTDTVHWWNGEAGILDFTDPRAAEWFQKRVQTLRERYNIDGFKFDAGETNYIPDMAILKGLERLQPESLSTEYANTVARIDSAMAEMHSVFMSQKLPIILRMDDKDSVWGYNNGLQAIVPTLLTLNMVGYSVILPDMIGGNGYNGIHPDKELFIRWLQACALMPVLQFSYPPWDFDNETIDIARKYVDLHANYTDLFLKLANRQMEHGTPINPPIWWIAPNDPIAQTIDSEFLVGEQLLVAPVLTQGAISRDVYLPSGTWRQVLRPDEPSVQGPVWLRNLSAPLDYLPLFQLVHTDGINITELQLA